MPVSGSQPKKRKIVIDADEELYDAYMALASGKRITEIPAFGAKLLAEVVERHLEESNGGELSDRDRLDMEYFIRKRREDRQMKINYMASMAEDEKEVEFVYELAGKVGADVETAAKYAGNSALSSVVSYSFRETKTSACVRWIVDLFIARSSIMRSELMTEGESKGFEDTMILKVKRMLHVGHEYREGAWWWNRPDSMPIVQDKAPVLRSS